MGQLEQMIAYQRAHEMLEEKSNERAEEMEARKPNMRRKQMLLNSYPAKLEGLQGGGKAGLMRVVGGAKKMNRGEEAAKKYLAMAEKMAGSGKPRLEIREMESDSDSESDREEKEEKEDMKGGFLPMLAAAAIPLLSNLFGSGKAPLKRGKAAHAMGRELGHRIKELHGEGFLDDLVSGIGSVVGKIFGAGSPAGAPASESAVAVYSKGVAPRRIVPNGIDSKAQQAPDYAPKWFRESGDIAGGAKAPFRTMDAAQTKKVMEKVAEGIAARKAAKAPMSGAGLSGGKRALSERQIKRNALVKKLMAEKGMKLGEASRYIKEHDLV